MRDIPLQSHHRGDGFLERTVWIGRHRMFGIVTEPDVRRTSTQVVFVPDAFTPHSGLSRIWTELARAWARQGVGSVRFDVSGCGDSDPRPGLEGHRRHVVEHIHDTAEVLEHVDPTDSGDVVLVGLSSGAYHSLEVALRRPVRAVAMVNPLISFAPPEGPTSPDRQAIQQTRPDAEPAGGAPPRARARSHVRPVRRARGLHVDARHGGLPLEAQRPPGPGLGARHGLVASRTVRAAAPPGQGGAPDRRARHRRAWVTGPDDWRVGVVGARRGLHRLEQGGGLRVTHVDHLDHSMRRGGAKSAVTKALTPFVLGQVREPAPQPTTLAG